MNEISVKITGLEKAREKMQRYQGKPFQTRIEKSLLAGARLLVPPVRAATKKGKTGNLRKSVKADRVGFGSGYAPKYRGGIRGAWVGPTAPHSHLVIHGTKPHDLDPGYAMRLPDDSYRTALVHPGAVGNPYVRRVVDANWAPVRKYLAQSIFGQADL